MLSPSLSLPLFKYIYLWASVTSVSSDTITLGFATPTWITWYPPSVPWAHPLGYLKREVFTWFHIGGLHDKVSPPINHQFHLWYSKFLQVWTFLFMNLLWLLEPLMREGLSWGRQVSWVTLWRKVVPILKVGSLGLGEVSRPSCRVLICKMMTE